MPEVLSRRDGGPLRGMKMVRLRIDGREVEIEEGRTILEAAKKAGIRIPTLCYHERLLPIASCRLCLVEVEGFEKPVTACNTMVQEGMSVRTQSSLLSKLRKESLKLILINHPLDCPICDRGGECELQNLVYELGVSEEPYVVEEKRERGPQGQAISFIRHWPDRCVLCLRCVRACQEITGARALELEGTGYGARIKVKEDRCLKCGECVRVCPIGAMTERTVFKRARSWQRQEKETVCSHCSLVCEVKIKVFEGEAIGVSSEKSLCGKGFFGFQYLNPKERLLKPLMGTDGYIRGVSFGEAVEAVQTALRKTGPERFGVILGGRLTLEEGLYVKEVLTQVGVKEIGSTSYFHTGPFFKAFGEVFGEDHPGRSLEEVKEADLVFLLGDLEGENPVLANWVREALFKNGARLILLYPRRVLLGEEADCFLQVKAGDEGLVLGWLIQELGRRKGLEGLSMGFDLERVKDKTHLPEGLLKGALEILSEAKRPSFIVSSLYGLSPNGQALMEAVMTLGVLCGAMKDGGGIHLVGPEANMIGLSLILKDGLSPLEILRKLEKGELQGLFVFGEDLFYKCPKGLLERALKDRFLVVWDLYLGPLAQKAKVFIPGLSHGEKEGHFIDSSYRLKKVRPVFSAEKEAIPISTFMEEVGAGFGLKIDPQKIQRALEELLKGVKRFEGEGKVKVPSFNFTEGPRLFVERAFLNHHVGTKDELKDPGMAEIVGMGRLLIHPDDLPERGLKEVRLVGAYGETILEVEESLQVPSGSPCFRVGLNPVSLTEVMGEEGEVPYVWATSIKRIERV